MGIPTFIRRLLNSTFAKVLWTILPAVSKLTGNAKAVKMSSKDPTLSSFVYTPGVSKGGAENNHYFVRFCVSLRPG